MLYYHSTVYYKQWFINEYKWCSLFPQVISYVHFIHYSDSDCVPFSHMVHNMWYRNTCLHIAYLCDFETSLNQGPNPQALGSSHGIYLAMTFEGISCSLKDRLLESQRKVRQTASRARNSNANLQLEDLPDEVAGDFNRLSVASCGSSKEILKVLSKHRWLVVLAFVWVNLEPTPKQAILGLNSATFCCQFASPGESAQFVALFSSLSGASLSFSFSSDLQ